jgi:hypothetical protein
VSDARARLLYELEAISARLGSHLNLRNISKEGNSLGFCFSSLG